MPVQLDPIQKRISQMNEGPVLVVSGPGSGKTRVITARAVHLLRKVGVRPERLIIVTFTKAAADEMQGRITEQVGCETARLLHIQTIHSLCYEFLAKLGYTLNIQDEEDQRKRLGAIIKALDLPDELLQPYLQERSNALNRMKDLRKYQPSALDQKQFRAITRLYQEQQQREGFMDFDDLLVEMYKRLQTLPQLPGRYLLVDEFQDTSLLQYEILKSLAAPTNNFFAVGDDDQSIYSWRGASNSPLQFLKDFPQAERVALTTNYRSTKQIVSLSSALIEQNRERLTKKLEAESQAPLGSRPTFIVPQDEKGEAKAIVQAVEAAYKEGLDWKDMAVIYRVNNQAFLLQQELAKRNIPFCVLGGEPQTLQHWIARGLLGYLEAALYPTRSDLLFYLLNRPSRYISKQVIAAAEALVSQGMAPLEALRSQALGESGLKAVHQLESDLARILPMKAQSALDYVRRKVGFDRFIQSTAETFRLDQQELEQIADTVCFLPEGDESVSDFVARIPELERATKRAKSFPGVQGVTLTTCHSAKGLEFGSVFLAGAVEGTLPYSKALIGQAAGGLEEERRLAYVAVTRSENRLLISSPKTMRGKKVTPSRFVGEIRQGILYAEMVPGEWFDHPAWGRCQWGPRDGEIVSVTKPDGEVKRISIAWLREHEVI